jgi:5-methyltetrahydropteroyltriglutamate--homocysteine methyltransferase
VGCDGEVQKIAGYALSPFMCGPSATQRAMGRRVKRSETRILTTHTGSLARNSGLQSLLLAQSRHEEIDNAKLQEAATKAVSCVVRRQVNVGLDIINDGEQGKTGFAQYVRERLSGFEGDAVQRVTSLEARDFPEAAGGAQWQQPCRGSLAWKDFAATERDIVNLRKATAAFPEREVFMTSVSPGTFTNNNPNQYYRTRQDYLTAVVEVMKREYEAIAMAGFILQIDSPDLAQRSYNFPDTPFREWRAIVADNIDAINEATKSISRDRIRVHVCWGANEGPHNHDTELHSIVDLLMHLRADAVSVVASNGRHEHEWRVWRGVELPDGMSLIPGVIDSTTNIIEHPETVAERIQRFAEVVGRERVIAGVDCGFGTRVTSSQVDAEVAWAKLASLVQGAAIASRRLWN